MYISIFLKAFFMPLAILISIIAGLLLLANSPKYVLLTLCFGWIGFMVFALIVEARNPNTDKIKS
jgi:hypothetical protein